MTCDVIGVYRQALKLKFQNGDAAAARSAARLGPGLITGAADDDPSGIATYSQAGAQFRFSLVWTLFLTLPLMIGIQMLSARIGWVTQQGLASNIGKICPRWLTVSLVSLLQPLALLLHQRHQRQDKSARSEPSRPVHWEDDSSA